MSGLELSRCSGKQTAEEVKAQQERLEEAHTAALDLAVAMSDLASQRERSAEMQQQLR